MLNFASFTLKSLIFITDRVLRMNDGSLRGIKYKSYCKTELCAVTIDDRSELECCLVLKAFSCFLCSFSLNFLSFDILVAPRRFSEDGMNNVVRFVRFIAEHRALFTTLKFE